MPFRSYHVKMTLSLVSNFKTMQYNSNVNFLSTVSVCAVYHFIWILLRFWFGFSITVLGHLMDYTLSLIHYKEKPLLALLGWKNGELILKLHPCRSAHEDDLKYKAIKSRSRASYFQNLSSVVPHFGALSTLRETLLRSHNYGFDLKQTIRTVSETSSLLNRKILTASSRNETALYPLFFYEFQ